MINEISIHYETPLLMINFKVSAPSFKPEIRLQTKKPSSEGMTQSDEHKKLLRS